MMLLLHYVVLSCMYRNYSTICILQTVMSKCWLMFQYKNVWHLHVHVCKCMCYSIDE